MRYNKPYTEPIQAYLASIAVRGGSAPPFFFLDEFKISFSFLVGVQIL